MKPQYKKLHKIELADDDFQKDGLRIRVVKLFWDKDNYTCLTIPQLEQLLEYWIIGEEERYPQEKGFKGRKMIKEVIDDVFRRVPIK